MNKMEEIKYWVEQRMVAETRAKYAIERIKELDRLAEAEKPELRHGDWWLSRGDNGEIRVFLKEYNGNKRDCVALRSTLITNIGSEYADQPIQGNIFDMMKDWGKDLTHFELDVNHYSINTMDFPHAPVHIAGNWHTEAEAYKFWCDFGQMIMTLKRKKQGD